MTSPCGLVIGVESPDMSAIEISSSVAVAVPPAVAWDVIADFSRNPEWQRGMKSARWVTEAWFRPRCVATPAACFVW